MDYEKIKTAIALTQQKKFSEAEKLYKELLQEYPNNEIILSAFGLFYVSIKKYDKACEILKQACNIKETLGTLSALGFAEFEQNNFEQAALYLEKSLDYGENPDIYNKLILSLFETKNYQKAIEYSNKMYALYPEDNRSIANKVKTLTQNGELLQAEKICVEALKKDPSVASLWFHLGFLKELIYSDDKQAKECYKIVADLGKPEAFYNIAVSCQKLQEYSEAEKYYKKMLEYFPNDNSTITSLGMCYLSQKKFKEGYELFFKRDKSKFAEMSNNFWMPNQELASEIVIICDQGFGDHIQFIRYLPFLKNKKVSVACSKSLKELFKNNYPNINFIDYAEINPNTQALFITDLAYILNIDFNNIPFSEGYLKSDTSEIISDKKKIGLCWEAGSAGIRTMINRTINIKCFEPLLNMNNIQIYSFQVNDTLEGNKKYPQMINLAKDFKDFSDTAKALKAMDTVITVDTSVAHLSGALGVKTFLLLPYTTDWRWFQDTEKTPWYKSIEIFKQTDSISWEKPINEIIEKLQS